MDTLLRIWPSSLIRKSNDGIIEINSDLFDFLCERYALQIEFETLSSTINRYYHELYFRYKNVSKENYNDKITDYVITKYNITDSNVLKLKDFSIFDILLGRPF